MSDEEKEDAAKKKKSVRVRAPPALDFAALFPELPPDAPATLEIGFGLGDSLVEMATKFPRERFLGAEVHKPGIGAALRKLRSFGIENVRVSAWTRSGCSATSCPTTRSRTSACTSRTPGRTSKATGAS